MPVIRRCSDRRLCRADETRGVDENLTGLDLPAGGLDFHQLENKLLRQALAHAQGNQTKAARLLNLSRDTFRYRLEKHGLL